MSTRERQSKLMGEQWEEERERRERDLRQAREELEIA